MMTKTPKTLGQIENSLTIGIVSRDDVRRARAWLAARGIDLYRDDVIGGRWMRCGGDLVPCHPEGESTLREACTEACAAIRDTADLEATYREVMGR
jgi:hypothetical protein